MPAAPPPSAEALRAYAEGFNASLTLRHFGATLDFPEGTRVRATLPIQPQHRGGLGTSAVNGAVIAGLFDLIIGCSAALIDPRRRSATIQLSMSMERPTAGDVVTCEGWIDRAGGSTIFSSAVIRDETGQITARCQGVVRLGSIPWEDGSSPKVV
jgi:acyl-coenzyme A thioesterase PaaI-like protein